MKAKSVEENNKELMKLLFTFMDITCHMLMAIDSMEESTFKYYIEDELTDMEGVAERIRKILDQSIRIKESLAKELEAEDKGKRLAKRIKSIK